MASWWPRWGTVMVVSCLLTLLMTVASEPSCNSYRGYPGHPGVPGSHGADGKDGSKGEMGDPGEAGHGATGQKGEAGQSGPPGRSGLQGDPGQLGPRGPAGPPGETGSAAGTNTTQKSCFSYKRNTNQPPPPDTAMRFDWRLLEHSDPLAEGVFRCTIKGVYFFTYHVSAKNLVCLNLKKGAETKVGFCDSSQGFLVTSGSVVLELNVGEEVSLHPTENNGVITKEGRQDNIFTGFLLFPTS